MFSEETPQFYWRSGNVNIIAKGNITISVHRFSFTRYEMKYKRTITVTDNITGFTNRITADEEIKINKQITQIG